ncbi:uncharacterized protein LOC112598051 [Melanaphis sacchari]|uniref:uncharacterized protein LOC112598051 n=1 Tax=Melanaphis sacchari TaxID=742174 RepID=UPI000DC14517|nr:uncharacterized protein LOC112598051 [Melanaphis sacchari]
MHQGYSLCHRKPLPKFEIEALFRLLMLCEVWINNSGLSHLKEIDASILNKNFRLCSMHFENSMFRNEQQNRLKLDAVPTLFESSENNSAETKRRKELESVMSSNPELAEDYSIMTCLKVVEKYCSPTVRLIVKSQIDYKNRKSKGYRYSNDIKQLALSIFFISAKLYKNMQRALYLPSC